jgi:hypothetical protein
LFVSHEVDAGLFVFLGDGGVAEDGKDVKTSNVVSSNPTTTNHHHHHHHHYYYYYHPHLHDGYTEEE